MNLQQNSNPQLITTCPPIKYCLHHYVLAQNVIHSSLFFGKGHTVLEALVVTLLRMGDARILIRSDI